MSLIGEKEREGGTEEERTRHFAPFDESGIGGSTLLFKEGFHAGCILASVHLIATPLGIKSECIETQQLVAYSLELTWQHLYAVYSKHKKAKKGFQIGK